MRLFVALCLSALATACTGSCSQSDEGWDIAEAQAPPTVAAAPDACQAARDFVRELGIVDDATIDRAVPGRITEIREDTGADGVTDRCWVFLYDADGREVVRLADWAAPTGADYIHWTVERLDDRIERARTDLDGDGTFDRESTSGFDERGRYAWSAVDEGLDGTIDRRAIFTDDARGRQIVQEFDDGDDGVIDGVEQFEWDTEDRLVRSEWDEGADGEADRISEYSYVGRTITSFLEQRRTTTGWQVDRHRAEVDAQTRPTIWASDLGDDGVDDIRFEWIREGSVETELRDFDADGDIDGVAETVTDELVTTIREDYENDGAWDSIRRQFRNSNGFTVTFETIDPVTGEATHRQTSVYAD